MPPPEVAERIPFVIDRPLPTFMAPSTEAEATGRLSHIEGGSQPVAANASISSSHASGSFTFRYAFDVPGLTITRYWSNKFDSSAADLSFFVLSSSWFMVMTFDVSLLDETSFAARVSSEKS